MNKQTNKTLKKKKKGMKEWKEGRERKEGMREEITLSDELCAGALIIASARLFWTLSWSSPNAVLSLEIRQR